MGLLRGSRYEGVAVTLEEVRGRLIYLPEVDDLPIADLTSVPTDLREGAGAGTQWDQIAVEEGYHESEWWKFALPNYEEAPDLLAIPPNVVLAIPGPGVIGESGGGDLTPAYSD